MTAPTGWLCPSCGKAHGPHVDTCPDAGVRVCIHNRSGGHVSTSERQTELGRVIKVVVSKAISDGTFDPAMGKRYGYGTRNVIRAR